MNHNVLNCISAQTFALQRVLKDGLEDEDEGREEEGCGWKHRGPSSGEQNVQKARTTNRAAPRVTKIEPTPWEKEKAEKKKDPQQTNQVC